MLLPVPRRRILRPSPPSTAFRVPAGVFPVDSRRRCSQPHSTTPHPSRAGVPTWLPDALGCRPSAAGGQGATVSTFPRVPLTREPTCTLAIDPGASGSTLTPADTSRPSRSPGHFPDFPWSGSPWLAHGSPLHGDRFPNPTGLLLGAFCRPIYPALFRSQPCDSPFPFASSRLWPSPRVRFPTPRGPLFSSCHTPSPALSLHPVPHPVFIPHRAASNPLARAHWILIHPGTVSCSLHGSLLSPPLFPCSGCFLLPSLGRSSHGCLAFPCPASR